MQATLRQSPALFITLHPTDCFRLVQMRNPQPGSTCVAIEMPSIFHHMLSCISAALCLALTQDDSGSLAEHHADVHLSTPTLWGTSFLKQLRGALPLFTLLGLNSYQYGRKGSRAHLIHLLFLIKLLLAVAPS